MLNKKPNCKAVLASLIFQTEERKVLLCLDEFLKSVGRNMAVYIHDGGYVNKLEKETEFPPELLITGAAYILEKTGYNIKLEEKPIAVTWTSKSAEKSQYMILKKDFEKKNFLIGPFVCCIHEDGFMERLSYGNAQVKFMNISFMEFNAKFFARWAKDKDRLQFEISWPILKKRTTCLLDLKQKIINGFAARND